jgi:hypothetical protein
MYIIFLFLKQRKQLLIARYDNGLPDIPVINSKSKACLFGKKNLVTNQNQDNQNDTNIGVSMSEINSPTH